MYSIEGVSQTLLANSGGHHEPKVGIPVSVDAFQIKEDKTITVKLHDADGSEIEVPAVWYEKYNCYIAIRRLTPRECFRLQGWADVYFDRAAFVNSDAQLYKQAGNSVTVNVVAAIANKMNEVMRKEGNDEI